MRLSSPVRFKDVNWLSSQSRHSRAEQPDTLRYSISFSSQYKISMYGLERTSRLTILFPETSRCLSIFNLETSIDARSQLSTLRSSIWLNPEILRSVRSGFLLAVRYTRRGQQLTSSLVNLFLLQLIYESLVLFLRSKDEIWLSKQYK